MRLELEEVDLLRNKANNIIMNSFSAAAALHFLFHGKFCLHAHARLYVKEGLTLGLCTVGLLQHWGRIL